MFFSLIISFIIIYNISILYKEVRVKKTLRKNELIFFYLIFGIIFSLLTIIFSYKYFNYLNKNKLYKTELTYSKISNVKYFKEIDEVIILNIIDLDNEEKVIKIKKKNIQFKLKKEVSYLELVECKTKQTIDLLYGYIKDNNKCDNIKKYNLYF